jgi:sortase B
MSKKRRALRLINSIVSLVLGIILFLFGAYAVYALWDNNQVYQAAEDVQLKLKKLKPSVDGESGPTFEELLKVNPDVCAWITMDGTKIDYPVLQGENNLTYINKDVYGNFALAGSVFLDCRNRKDFSDPYVLLYGHHMSESHMFGDLDLYETESFFRKNTTGTLLLPGKVYDLQVLAFVKVTASEEEIFNLDIFRSDSLGVARFVQQKAKLKNEELNTITEQDQLLALSTCSSDFTDARVIVLTKMIPR